MHTFPLGHFASFQLLKPPRASYNTGMESIIRNVKDLPREERRVYEDVLGHELRENQQIILQVITLHEPPEEPTSGVAQTGTLPEWCNVYEGLSDEQITELEEVILTRADLTRSSD